MRAAVLEEFGAPLNVKQVERAHELLAQGKFLGRGVLAI